MAATVVTGAMTLPRAQAGTMTVSVAVVADEPDGFAARVAHAEEMDAAWQTARALMDDLAGARRRRLAMLN